MTLRLLKQALERFLGTSDPEIICVTGKWGVGKTFAWNQCLIDAQREKKVALKRYAYVSLFGLSSLAEFKHAVFENLVDAQIVGLKPSAETLQANAKSLGRKSVGLLQRLPIIKDYAAAISPYWFLNVRDCIVCIDDIERKGQGLSIRDVLGLASVLKEERRCKVVLVLNEEQLHDPNEFKLFFEKVVDSSISFAPSAEECAAIAVTGDDDVDKMLRTNCIRLGISNIRVINRLKRLARQVEPSLVGFHPDVLKQALHSLVLLGWSTYEPAAAPSLSYVRNTHRRGIYGPEKRKDLSPEEVPWSRMLAAYEFETLDDLDLALDDGIAKGFFDADRLREVASAMHQRLQKPALDSFEEAWRRYHDTFADDQEEVLDKMFEAFAANVTAISPINLNGTVKLFKQLGRNEQAQEMIVLYVEKRSDDARFFDLTSYDFASDVSDPDIVQAFNTKAASYRDNRDPAAVLREISIKDSWNREDIDLISSMPEEWYFRTFRALSGRELRKAVSWCVDFGRTANATPQMVQIAGNAVQALRRIEATSPMNQLRVKRFRTE